MYKCSLPTVLDDPMGAKQSEMFRHCRSVASHQIDEFSHSALPAAEAVHNLQSRFIGQSFQHLCLLREYVAFCHRSLNMAEWPYMQVQK